MWRFLIGVCVVICMIISILFFIMAKLHDSQDDELRVSLLLKHIAAGVGVIYKTNGKSPENVDFLLSPDNWTIESQKRIQRMIFPSLTKTDQIDFGLDKMTYRPVFEYAAATPPESGVIAIVEYGPNRVSPLRTEDLGELLTKNVSLVKRIPRIPLSFGTFNSMTLADKENVYSMLSFFKQKLDSDDKVGIYDLGRLEVVQDDDGATHACIDSVLNTSSWSLFKDDPSFTPRTPEEKAVPGHIF